jgi:hypothetical protein
MSQTPLFENLDPISVYTRAQALDDGSLVDVTAVAREARFKTSVALTAAVWADCVSWDNSVEKCHQDERGRLWDVLWMAALAGTKSPNDSTVPFAILRIPHRGSKARQVQLVMTIGPGDDGEPVVTIMQPGED